MRAHIVGGGFGGLAAAAYLIRNAGVPGPDITIYEAEARLGGGFFLGGDAQSGYNLPGSVFDSEFRCTFGLLADVPSTRDPAVSVRDEFFTFNAQHPFHDWAHIIDREGRILHSPRYGLSLRHGIDLVKLSLMPEALLDGRRIEEFFPDDFFRTEFWLLWSTIMGSLPQHGAAEFRRYINRALNLFPDLSDMQHILRTPICQFQAFIEPLAAWLRKRDVTFQTGTSVRDIGLAPVRDRITVERLEIERGGAVSTVTLGPEDIVLLTTGSQAAGLSAGSMTEPPPKRDGRSSWSLWQRLARSRPGFGDPEVFFSDAVLPDSRWVTFTVTTTGDEFIDRMTAITGSEPGRGGLVTLKDSGWVVSLSIFHQPEVIGQPDGTKVWWGYGLYPERSGDFVRKRMDECTGAEILEEVLRQLRFDGQLDAIMASSICIPCDMPYVNNIWMPRRRTDRPPPVPEGSTNLGLIGQYVEVEQDVAFTIEYSARTAWEAIHTLLRRGPAPPPVYQGRHDPKALLGALRAFVAE
ncbi:oleate hydratase [Roseomonas elaeocarpi]|uniref:Oleate hydratase n=1 Tax=Roseomonas elaeocarpi TaxID=907779 RepID=A0ABV6JMD9_9PROT